jgi:hypothetical protein
MKWGSTGSLVLMLNSPQLEGHVRFLLLHLLGGDPPPAGLHARTLGHEKRDCPRYHDHDQRRRDVQEHPDHGRAEEPALGPPGLYLLFLFGRALYVLDWLLCVCHGKTPFGEL